MIKGISIHIDNEEDLSRLFYLAKEVSTEQITNALPNTSNALYEAATAIQNAWKDWAQGGQIPGVENIPRPNQRIADSIERTPNEPRFSDYLISSDNPYMADLQNGKDETIDMKAPGSPWLNGKHSRLNKKDGSPYLIVPFSWGVPGKSGGSAHFRNVVPRGIMNALRRRQLSMTAGTTHPEPNARGEMIERNEYSWGGRVSKEEAESAGNTRTAGMVRMWDSAYTKKESGTYFTFRVISAKSAADKWIQHRHIKPHDVTGALAREFEQMIQQNVNDALLADIGL